MADEIEKKIEDPVEEEDKSFDNNNLKEKKRKDTLKSTTMEEKRFHKSVIMFGVLVASLCGVYIFDSLMFVIFDKELNNSTVVLEAIKTLLFSLSGYLFAKRTE